jgi:FlaA1/EpsC-like NDP-sugar epimerase
MKGGEIFVPKIPSYRLMDLVKAFSANPKIKLIGLRPGEKLHEEMVSVYDSPNTVESKDYFSIYSSIDKNLKKNMTFCKKGFTYSSKENSKFLTVSQIQKLISHL